MTTTQYNTANTEGINFGLTYTAYDQTAASSSTNSPDNPGPPFTPGTVVKGSGDSEFVFVQAASAITAGWACIISSTFTAAGVTTTTATGSYGKQVGVAVVSIASSAYGWLQRGGLATPTGQYVAVDCNPYVRLTTTASAGILDDATTTALVYIDGIVINSTATSATASVKVATLNNPVVSTVIP